MGDKCAFLVNQENCPAPVVTTVHVGVGGGMDYHGPIAAYHVEVPLCEVHSHMFDVPERAFSVEVPYVPEVHFCPLHGGAHLRACAICEATR